MNINHLYNIAPRTSVASLKIAVLLSVAGYTSLSAAMVYKYFFVDMHSFWNLLLAALLAVIAKSLWSLKSWSKNAFKVVAYIACVVVIFGIFQPIYASSYNSESSDGVLFLFFIIPSTIVGLWCDWVFDRYSSEFS